MEKKFLDETGLRHLIANKIKPELDKKVSLDENGMIPADKLPSYVDDVVEFEGFVDDATILTESFGGSTVYTVVYVRAKKCFAAQTGLTQAKTYYNNWGTRENYQELNGNPYGGKIFVDINTNKTYRWGGTELVEISSGGVSLGETSSTAYAGDKGAQNAKDIQAIKDGDLPLVGLSIANFNTSTQAVVTPWKVKTADGTSVACIALGSLDTLYGYTVTFTGSYKWQETAGYKSPTAVNGGNWKNKMLPKSGLYSEEITVDNITSDTTITASVKAPKQGLIVENGYVKAASAADFDTKSASISVHFQYKVFAGAVTSALDKSGLEEKLQSSIKGGSYVAQNGRGKVLTGVTTTSQQYYVYAYPSKLGKLTKITMNDAVPLLDGGFTFKTLTVKDPETGMQLEYNVYTSEQMGAFSNAKLDIA